MNVIVGLGQRRANGAARPLLCGPGSLLRGSRRRGPAAVAASLIAVGVLSMQPAAAAAGPSWTVQPSPNARTPGSLVTAVSCSGASACTAIAYTARRPDQPTSVLRWNGRTWTTQVTAAVGNGGLKGVGLANSSQKLFYLPAPHTDFIFAAWSEEHGFVGAVFVLLLYFFILMRLIQNAQTAADLSGTLLIMGVVAVLIFQIAVNVGMVVGLMPVTGIPLPLMSYGGSSVLFTFLALGIVMNVRMNRFVN